MTAKTPPAPSSRALTRERSSADGRSSQRTVGSLPARLRRLAGWEREQSRVEHYRGDQARSSLEE